MSLGLWALEWHEPVFAAVRGAAAVGGAIFGWVLAGPTCRLLTRALFRKPAPRTLVFLARVGGAVGLACIIFYFLPLGFGGGAGWGFGPGPGGRPGTGGGSGADANKTTAQAVQPHNDAAPKREPLDIALIDGDKYQGDGKFYLLERRPPPVTLEEVKKYFEGNRGRLDVRIILTRESPGESHPAVRQLRSLGDKYDIPTRVDAPR